MVYTGSPSGYGGPGEGASHFGGSGLGTPSSSGTTSSHTMSGSGAPGTHATSTSSSTSSHGTSTGSSNTGGRGSGAPGTHAEASGTTGGGGGGGGYHVGGAGSGSTNFAGTATGTARAPGTTAPSGARVGTGGGAYPGGVGSYTAAIGGGVPATGTPATTGKEGRYTPSTVAGMMATMGKGPRSLTGLGIGTVGEGLGPVNVTMTPSITDAMTKAKMDRMETLSQVRDINEASGLDSYSRMQAEIAANNRQINEQRARTQELSRTSEINSMADMARWGQNVKSVVSSGPDFTEVELNDGSRERRTGTRSQRNNNPGNIMGGDWARRHGAVDNDQPNATDLANGRPEGLAVFASPEDGLQAMKDLLSENYSNRPLGEIVANKQGKGWAPDPVSSREPYTRSFTDNLGLDRRTTFGQLSSADKDRVVRAMADFEAGQAPGYAVTPTGIPTKDYGDPRAYTASQTNIVGGQPAVERGPATPAVAPASQPNVPGQVQPAAPGQAVPTQRTQAAGYPKGFQKAMATGLDILTGFVPGVGTPVSIYNLIASLTGQPTSGQAIMNYLSEHPNQYQPGSQPERPGGGGGLEPQYNTGGMTGTSEGGLGTPSPAAPTEEPTSPADDFINTYIDPTWRPTPLQKWGAVQNPYTEFPYATA